MANVLLDGCLWRRNSKLETFLKRNLKRDVYERIRAYEPCVVVSETLSKVFMYVVLGDDCIYLTEYPPRSLWQAVHFARILNIELINDFPDFLSGREREQSLHICVVHTSAKYAGKSSPTNRSSVKLQSGSSTQLYNDAVSPSLERKTSVLLSTHPTESSSWDVSDSSKRGDNDYVKAICRSRSASFPPNPSSVGLDLPQVFAQLHSAPDTGLLPLATTSQPKPYATNRRSSILPKLLKKKTEMGGEEVENKEAELHLYAVSLNSRLYLHLQRSWNSYIMRSTLMLDPPYMRTCNVLSSPSQKKQKQQKISWERTSHLFSQLKGELLQEETSLESLYLLLKELCTAGHRIPAIKKLFWRSPELYPFLVKILVESMQLPQDRLNTLDRLLLCTSVVQALSLMFHETEIEPARLSMLTSKQGGITMAMLFALVCDPVLQLPDPAHHLNGQASSFKELQALQAKYLDAASVLLFEVVVFCQDASRTPDPGHILTVGWVFKTLKSHPFLPQFIGYQAQQVVVALSESKSSLSPSQAILLYQRCCLLLACLHYSSHLSSLITTEFKEEFRYYVGISGLHIKLPPHYPISVQAQRIISQLLSLVLHNA